MVVVIFRQEDFRDRSFRGNDRWLKVAGDFEKAHQQKEGGTPQEVFIPVFIMKQKTRKFFMAMGKMRYFDEQAAIIRVVEKDGKGDMNQAIHFVVHLITGFFRYETGGGENDPPEYFQGVGG